MHHITRSRRAWPSLLSHSVRRPKAVVLYRALHSLSPSLTGTTPITSTPDFSETPRIISGSGARKGRNLVLCFDGTGEQYDKDYTNIVRFFRLLKKGDPSRQMVYYQAGIGTGITNSGPSNPILKKINYVLDQAFGTGLPTHVRGGYEFLMNNYQEGDRISLFGFSRGAYTARVLAGMLQTVGLLPAHNKEQIKYAYKTFQRAANAGLETAQGFKKTFSIDVKIDFVGVFDTVNSVGLIPQELPFARSNYLIRVFRHAVALDERRTKFKAHLWRCCSKLDKSNEGGKREKDSKPESSGLIRNGLSWAIGRKGTRPAMVIHRGGHGFASGREVQHPTNVKEVWFAGAHSDVGGGSVLNGTPNHLARIPLRWMIRECFRNDTGILFDDSELEKIGLTPATLTQGTKVLTSSELNVVETHGSDAAHHEGAGLNKAQNLTVANSALPSLYKMIPTESVRLNTTEDEIDAIQPLHDQLSHRWLWWILEFLPMRHDEHHGTSWSWFPYNVNFGRPREIPHRKGLPTYVHKSVMYRQQMGYEPRVREILKRPEVQLVE